MSVRIVLVILTSAQAHGAKWLGSTMINLVRPIIVRHMYEKCTSVAYLAGASSCHLYSTRSCTSPTVLSFSKESACHSGCLLPFQAAPLIFRLHVEDPYLAKWLKGPRPARGRMLSGSTNHAAQPFPSLEVGPAPSHLCTQRLLYHLCFTRRTSVQSGLFRLLPRGLLSLSPWGGCSWGSSFSL